LKDYEELNLDDWKIKDRQIRRIGAQITNDRQRYIDAAKKIEMKE